MRTIRIVGLIILFTGVVTVTYFSESGVQQKASSIVRSVDGVTDPMCEIEVCPIREELVIKVPAKIPLEEGAVIEIMYEQSGLGAREVTVQTSGANFKISPSSAESRIVYDSARWVWVVSPEKLGKQIIVLHFSGVSSALLNDNQQGRSTITLDAAMQDQANNFEHRFTTNEPIVYTVQVIDTFGFSMKQGRLLGYITSFLGSALTFPWLHSIWEKRREQNSKSQVEAMQKEHQQKIDELEKQLKDKEEKRKKK